MFTAGKPPLVNWELWVGVENPGATRAIRHPGAIFNNVGADRAARPA